MQLYSKEGLLFIIQADHLCGEDIGEIIGSFYTAGAKNVQVISAVTKKNRPSYMIFVDAAPGKAEEIEKVIVRELRSSGWHRIETCHRHTNVSVEEKQIRIITDAGTYDVTVRGKVIDDDLKNVRPEFDDCRDIKEMLKANEDAEISVMEIRQALAEAFGSGIGEVYFDFRR